MEGSRAMQKRRKFKPPITSLEERLASQAKRLRDEAAMLPTTA